MLYLSLGNNWHVARCFAAFALELIFNESFQVALRIPLSSHCLCESSPGSLAGLAQVCNFSLALENSQINHVGPQGFGCVFRKHMAKSIDFGLFASEYHLRERRALRCSCWDIGEDMRCVFDQAGQDRGDAVYVRSLGSHVSTAVAASNFRESVLRLH